MELPLARRVGLAPGTVRTWFEWRRNRLQCMTGAEVVHRIVSTVGMHAERAGFRGSRVVPEPTVVAQSRPWVHATARVAAARYVAEADRIAAGRWDLFAFRDCELGSPPLWNRDPKSGVDAPITFGKLIDHRAPRVVGDIKYLWEINRHLHLVTLAQAYALTGDRRHFDVLRLHLESWFSACPHLMGPNWSSALEVAIRLINWSVAWQLMGGAASAVFVDEEGARFRRRWLDCAFRHAEFIRGHFSRYSSANNHLLGEAAGLYVAALTWPCWPQASAWLAEAREILEREALLQNAPDGVNREQAVSYQQFVLDLLLVPVMAGRANGKRLSAAYEARIEAMLEYLASIMDAGGNVPLFGDSDDAAVVKLAVNPDFCSYRSLLASGALLFRRADFKVKAGALDDKTRWLFGEGADASFAGIGTAGVRLPVRQAFPSGGYHILGCDFETDAEIRLVADAGPVGYQAIAAHGHADALSFTLSVGGSEFLVDPGTYAYHTNRAWRDYFRGTGAHNTVRIDGMNQSQSGGNFMWLHQANAACSLWSSGDERDLFEGWHDGYMRLADPVLHRRRITVDKKARRIAVVDRLEMADEHEVELLFHCSEMCRVDRVAAGYALSRESRTLILQLPQVAAATSRVYRGSVAPIVGWVSRRFDEKHPAPTIVWRARIEGPCVLRTTIAC